MALHLEDCVVHNDSMIDVGDIAVRKILGVFVLIIQPVFALDFSSKETAATVVELYTSEGCSSCPAADKWLSALQRQPKIFTEVIPLAFHVDYWNYLGWQDRFSQPAFSTRQRDMEREGILSQVYTPAFVVNGKEWRQSIWRHDSLPESVAKPGVLSVSLIDGEMSAHFSSQEKMVLNIAYVGMGLETPVTSGENSRKILQHDFVVLQHWQKVGKDAWQFSLPKPQNMGQQQTVLVAWLTELTSLVVVQAAAHRMEK